MSTGSHKIRLFSLEEKRFAGWDGGVVVVPVQALMKKKLLLLPSVMTVSASGRLGMPGWLRLLVRQISTLNEKLSRTDFFGDEFGCKPRYSAPRNSQQRLWIKPDIQIVKADWSA